MTPLSTDAGTGFIAGGVLALLAGIGFVIRAIVRRPKFSGDEPGHLHNFEPNTDPSPKSLPTPPATTIDKRKL